MRENRQPAVPMGFLPWSFAFVGVQQMVSLYKIKGSPQLLLGLAFIVIITAYPAIGLAQEKLEPTVINIGEVEWSTPGYRPCFPQGVQTKQLGADPENSGPSYFARFPAGSQFEIHWHTHSEYVVVVSGTGAIILADKRHTISPGSYVVIPGKVSHSWHVTPGGSPLFIHVRRTGPADFNFVVCEAE